tara:strand:- start:602 stop:907 length:306 start_codon:yes stop_codon:yes gene_type:complete
MFYGLLWSFRGFCSSGALLQVVGLHWGGSCTNTFKMPLHTGDSKMEEKEKQELLQFLDELKESGSINMFGAPKVLQEFFDLDRITAVKVWEEWTKRKLDDA